MAVCGIFGSFKCLCYWHVFNFSHIFTGLDPGPGPVVIAVAVAVPFAVAVAVAVPVHVLVPGPGPGPGPGPEPGPGPGFVDWSSSENYNLINIFKAPLLPPLPPPLSSPPPQSRDCQTGCSKKLAIIISWPPTRPTLPGTRPKYRLELAQNI